MTSNASDSEVYAAPASARRADPAHPSWLNRLAHDLRNPLSSLHTGIALLRSGKLSADQQSSLLSTIQRQLDALTQLIDDTAGLLRADAEVMQPTDIADLLDMVAARLSSRLDENGVEFQPPLRATATAIGNAKGLIRLTGFLILRIAQIIGRGGRILATVETRGSSVRLCFVPAPAAHGAIPEFTALANSLSLASVEHVADAALHEILQRHDATITVLGGAAPGIALHLPAA
jgi:light-regulated signal transduction histidine kinase (bacteriophytochrome)